MRGVSCCPRENRGQVCVTQLRESAVCSHFTTLPHGDNERAKKERESKKREREERKIHPTILN